MSTSPDAIQRDANRVPIQGREPFLVSKEVTYTALGDGAVGAKTLFTVTGDNMASVFAKCSVNLTGSGSISVGISGNTAGFIALTTGTDIDADEWWIDTAPATLEAVPASLLVAGNIIQTIATDTITAGVITFYCLYRPISSTGRITAA